MSIRFNEMIYSPFMTCLAILFFVSCIYAQQCGQPLKEARFDCHPDDDPTEDNCKNRSCCWEQSLQQSNLTGFRYLNAPACYYPSDFPTYEVTSNQTTPFGLQIQLYRSQKTYWDDDITNLTVDVIFATPQQLRIKIYDPNSPRYQVPELKASTVDKKADMTDYDVLVKSKPFAIIVTRKSTGVTLFNSSISPLIFANQFIQISTQLSSPLLYGFGEHQQPLLINITNEWKRLTFYSYDTPIISDYNLYGVHPFHINLERISDKPTYVHGQFFLNSNAMDVDLQPLPALTYTTIGGIIDLFIFTGPTVQNVIEQYWDVIGNPAMPPFWSLGFHLSRYGYKNIDNLKATIRRMHDADFPYDVQWTDIDAMSSYLDFTYDNTRFNGLPDLVHQLRSGGQRYVNRIDPGISSTQPAGSYPAYDEGIKRDIFIKKFNSTEPIIGQTEAGEVAFPDFTHPYSTEWWREMITAFHDVVPFDGVWLSKNEPSNFVEGSVGGCTDNSLDKPPYTPHVFGNILSAKSLCPSADQVLSSHYNLHSMYGHFQAKATNEALKSIQDKRPFVLSRSTFAGSGHFTAHWTGINWSRFEDMHFSIPAILNFNMFGITHVGADICGFVLNATEELCTRWMQLGAFYPFMRNHNDNGSRDQDPASFSWLTQQIMKQALLMRYSLIPYWYTLFFQSVTTSKTVVQPLFFEYPDDENTYNIDQQFLVGSAILVSPNLVSGSNTVHAYIPQDVWYEFSSGVQLQTVGDFLDLNAPIQKINVHVRGGFIIPMQTPGANLILGRGNPFKLLVALSQSGNASGNLFWDDGDSLNSIETETYNYFEFTAKDSNTLTIDPRITKYEGGTMLLNDVSILGVTKNVTNVSVNKKPYFHFSYNFLDQVLSINGLNINLLDGSSQIVEWTISK